MQPEFVPVEFAQPEQVGVGRIAEEHTVKRSSVVLAVAPHKYRLDQVEQLNSSRPE